MPDIYGIAGKWENQMDPVFDAHYRIVQDEFALRGISLEVAYTPNGDPDYIYERGRLLIAEPDDSFGRDFAGFVRAWMAPS